MTRDVSRDDGERDRRAARSERRARSASRPDSATARLQRTVGNRAVAELHERGELRAKLQVSEPADAVEREADRVADEVTDRDPSTDATPDVRRSSTTSDGRTVSDGSERRIRALKGGGRPLSAAERSFFEPRFGADFSDVRIHTGPAADAAARSIDAAAFTHGRDVAFRSGRYDPKRGRGRALAAHELTHVVQQGHAPTTGDGRVARRRRDGDDPAVQRQSEGETRARERDAGGRFERAGGGFWKFVAPNGEEFVSQSRGGARRMAVEAGAYDPVETRATGDDRDVIELEPMTVGSVRVRFPDREDEFVTEERARRVRRTLTDYIATRHEELRQAQLWHRNYLRAKVGGSTEGMEDTWAERFSRGFSQMAYDAAELYGTVLGEGSMDPPPLSIWDPVSDELLNAVDALAGNPVNVTRAAVHFERAAANLERARARWQTFEQATLQTGASGVLTTLTWTRDVSKGVFSGLASAATGGTYAAVAAGAGGAGFIEGTTRFAEQSSERMLGLREDYDWRTMGIESAEAAAVEAVAGLVAGPLLERFASKWATVFDSVLQKGSAAGGTAGRAHDAMWESLERAGVEPSHRKIRGLIYAIGGRSETGITVGLDLMHRLVAVGAVQKFTGTTLGVYMSWVEGEVPTERLVDEIFDEFVSQGVWETALVSLAESAAR